MKLYSNGYNEGATDWDNESTNMRAPALDFLASIVSNNENQKSSCSSVNNDDSSESESGSDEPRKRKQYTSSETNINKQIKIGEGGLVSKILSFSESDAQNHILESNYFAKLKTGKFHLTNNGFHQQFAIDGQPSSFNSEHRIILSSQQNQQQTHEINLPHYFADVTSQQLPQQGVYPINFGHVGGSLTHTTNEDNFNQSTPPNRRQFSK